MPKEGPHDDSEEQRHETSINEDEEQEQLRLQINIFNLWVEPPSRNGTRTHESIAEEEWSYPSLSDKSSHHTPDLNADRATLASTLKEDRIDIHSPPNSMARNYSPSSSSKFQESIYSPFSVYSKQQKLGNSIGLDQLSGGGGEQGIQNRHSSQKDADSRSVASSVYVMMEVKGSTTRKNEEDGKSVASTLLIDRQPAEPH